MSCVLFLLEKNLGDNKMILGLIIILSIKYLGNI